MSRVVYVNGEFLPEEEAKISIFDRGFLFADGVYEVSTILDGKMVDNAAHLERLGRSMYELGMAPPCSMEEIEAVQQEMLKRNPIQEGGLYLQVTRGAADRDFLYPDAGTKSSLIMFTQERPVTESPVAKRGLRIAFQPDIRWQRRDIKTVGLLPASMAKEAAKDEGADDAWMVEEGKVTEGTSNNAYIITHDNVIVTKALSNKILHGITRKAVLALAKEEGLSVEERDFTPEEAKAAKEAFVTSASTFVTAVVNIDGQTLGDGTPGPLTTRLREIYINFARQSLS